MAVIIKSLADARLISHTTEVVLDYVPPTGFGAVVKNIRLVNRGEDPATVRIECQAATAGRDTNSPSAPGLRKAMLLTLAANDMHVMNDEMTLAPGDKVRVVLALPAALVDVVISGIER